LGQDSIIPLVKWSSIYYPYQQLILRENGGQDYTIPRKLGGQVSIIIKSSELSIIE